MRDLVADRVTSLARTRLRPGAVGQVHSIFAGVLNLRLASPRSGADDEWLSLHCLPPDAPLPSPFAIACPPPRDAGAPVMAGVAPGLEVRVSANALWLGQAGRVDLRVAATVGVEPRAEAGPREPAGSLVATALARTRGGLLPAAAGVLRLGPTPDELLARVAAPRLARLAVATDRLDAAECRCAAIALLGLGPGLTPSGDDVLVGWVAALWASTREARRLVQEVRAELLAAAAERTTALSGAFLSAALAGAIAEPLHRFVRRPGPVSVDGLLQVGATSGADSLAGYLLAQRPRPGAIRSPSSVPRARVGSVARVSGPASIGGPP
jgi:hypothetical protein